MTTPFAALYPGLTGPELAQRLNTLAEDTSSRLWTPGDRALLLMEAARRLENDPGTLARVKATLLARAESYMGDSRRFLDMRRLHQVPDGMTDEECKNYQTMYRVLAEELRKVAASL